MTSRIPLRWLGRLAKNRIRFSSRSVGGQVNSYEYELTLMLRYSSRFRCFQCRVVIRDVGIEVDGVALFETCLFGM